MTFTSIDNNDITVSYNMNGGLINSTLAFFLFYDDMDMDILELH